MDEDEEIVGRRWRKEKKNHVIMVH